jgi:adenylate cyclase
MTFREHKLALFVADLAGFSLATARLDALGVAEFLVDWYARCGAAVAAHGGDMVKFMGDACFATFAEDHAGAAVDAALALRAETEAFARARGACIDLSAKVHLAVVADGDVELGGRMARDVFGSGVNHLFSMGGGAGIRISEPVYQELESAQRSAWREETRGPYTTYTLARS